MDEAQGADDAIMRETVPAGAGHCGKEAEPRRRVGRYACVTRAGSAPVAVTTASAPRRGRGGAGREPAGPLPVPSPPMPRKALLCVLQLDVRSVSARAAGARRLEEKRLFALPAPLPVPLPPLGRRPALPARGFLLEDGPCPVAGPPSGAPARVWLLGNSCPLHVCPAGSRSLCNAGVSSSSRSSHSSVEKVFVLRDNDSCEAVWCGKSTLEKQNRAKEMPINSILSGLCSPVSPGGGGAGPALGCSGAWGCRSAAVKAASFHFGHVRPVLCALAKFSAYVQGGNKAGVCITLLITFKK